MDSNARSKVVFLCHALEDNQSIVLPICAALDSAGISYWVDEGEVQWGDSLTSKVNAGLASSRYVIVVLSTSFVGKNWPERELNSVLNIEATTGEIKVLPLLVGDSQAIQSILKKYPLLNDKLYLKWNGNPDSVVQALEERSRPGATRRSLSKETGEMFPAIPLPRIRKVFSDREKDKFLEESFQTIKTYFKNALGQLQNKESDVETDFAEVTKLKFMSSIYVHGELKNQCVVWVGSITGGRQISYREGRQLRLDTDNSFNDWLSVDTDEYSLFLNPSGFGNFIEAEKNTSPEKGAEYLWRRFTQWL